MPVTLRVRPVGDNLQPQNSWWSLKGRQPSYDGLVDLRTGFHWPVTDRVHLYDHFNDFGCGCTKDLSTTSLSFIGQRLVSNWSATGEQLVADGFQWYAISLLRSMLGSLFMCTVYTNKFSNWNLHWAFKVMTFVVYSLLYSQHFKTRFFFRQNQMLHEHCIDVI